MTSTRQRKPHSKSRAGCLLCKKRHMKCGEERPSCQNCIDRETECTYGLATPRVPFSNSKAGSGTESECASHTSHGERQLPFRTSGSQDLATQSAITRMEELQLLFHYMNETTETMTTGDSDIDVWRKAIPDQASQHEFLMDGLLALSALHFASNNPGAQWRYVKFASRYQASGLRKYTLALQNATDKNVHALFAYAIVTMILALAFTTMHNDTTTSTSVDDVTSFFRLLRGIGTVNDVTGTHLKDGPFRALFHPVSAEDEKVDLGPDVAKALEQLVQRSYRYTEGEYLDRRQVYLFSIERLEYAFQRLETVSNLRYIMAWPAMVSQDLLGYLRHNDPMAQLIFLYYGVLLLRAHDRWWGKNFGLRLIKDLTASLCALDDDWASSTKWARECAAQRARLWGL